MTSSESSRSPRKIRRSEGSDDEGSMDEATRQALADIDECQKSLEELNDEASKEILKVEARYNKLRKPHYEKRAAVIDKIPNFWVNSIINHPQIMVLVAEEEEDCLHFLKKLEVEESENTEEGFRIKFIFEENPFFENQELVKEFQLGPNLPEAKSTSTEIKWKEHMDLSKKQPQIISGKRKRGEEENTFFSWFADNKDPAADDIAEVIKDDLWPNPLQYYLTPDMGDEEDEEEEGEESEEDEDMMREEDVSGAGDGEEEENADNDE